MPSSHRRTIPPAEMTNLDAQRFECVDEMGASGITFFDRGGHARREHVSADFYDTLNEEGEELLADVARRAEASDRKTVQSRNL